MIDPDRAPVDLGIVPSTPSPGLAWSGGLLGFALGGFFDGILLHQILQWHHLLSGIDRLQSDLATQILADGLFHALMYLIAAVGLWLLWRTRGQHAAVGAGRRLGGWALAGFGGWHVVDGLLSHWVLGIHRIRMDVPDPLLWDLIWLVAFGLAPLLLAWLLLRPRGGGGGGGLVAGRRRRASALALGLAVLVAAPVAALPPAGATAVTAVFGTGTTAADGFAAAAAVGGRVVWVDGDTRVWVIDLGGNPRAAWRLYAHGAWLVGASFGPIGCIGWSTA